MAIRAAVAADRLAIKPKKSGNVTPRRWMPERPSALDLTKNTRLRLHVPAPQAAISTFIHFTSPHEQDVFSKGEYGAAARHYLQRPDAMLIDARVR
jgi:hypothetical protein